MNLNAENESPHADEPHQELVRFEAEKTRLENLNAELRADRERLLRIMEEQVAATKYWASRPRQNTPIYGSLISLSLVLVLVLLIAALLFLHQTVSLSKEDDAGQSVSRSVDYRTGVEAPIGHRGMLTRRFLISFLE